MMRRRFDVQHEQAFGHMAQSEPVELVSMRLVSVGLVPQAKLSPVKSTGKKLSDARIGTRKIFFGREHGNLECALYQRGLLEPNHEIPGPAVVEQLDTTTLIHPEQVATVDNYLNLIVQERH
jgi:N-methylhydantoinase A